MNLPPIEQPQRFRGLYMYQFGEWTAVGCTAEEIAGLLESEAYAGGTVYKILRAYPDGRMELRGVAPERFRLESGLFFYRGELEPARADFNELRAAAQRAHPPCRAFVHLVDRSPQLDAARFVTALVFPAEYEDEIGQWLLAVGFQGGDRAEGGISHVSNYHAESKHVIERDQLWPQTAIPARSADELFASARRAAQA